MRVLGNIRLSRETDESTSPARQEEAITRWAELHGHQIVGWARDIDVSGSVSPWDRDELGAWLDEDRLHLWDIIVGSKVDRISRKLTHFVTLVDWCSERGKAVASATEPINTADRFGKMIAQILAMFAEFERDAIRERVQESYELAIAEGRWHGGTVPYGYMPEKAGKGEGYRLVVDAESSKVYREIVERYLKPTSLSQIAIDLNKAGVLPPTEFYRQRTGKPLTGAKWHATGVGKILRSRAALGVYERDGMVVRDNDGLPVRRADAIIDRETWDKVQARLEQTSKTHTRTTKTSPLLHIAQCLVCGEPMYLLTNRRVVGGEWITRGYYRCRGWRNKINGCTNSSVPAKVLHPWVETNLLKLIGDVEVFEQVLVPASEHGRELAEASQALADLAKMTAGKSEAVKQIYASQIAALEELVTRLAAMPQTEARMEEHPMGSTYRELWDASDQDERRALLLKSGIRVEAARQAGDAVSVGTFSRPERDDEALLLERIDDFSLALYLPKGLAERATRHQASNSPNVVHLRAKARTKTASVAG